MSVFSIPKIKVALYGPAESGKTTFRSALILRKFVELPSTEKPSERKLYRKYKYRSPVIGASEEINYLLVLLDLPGRDEYKELRMRALHRVSGYIFFYDASDRDSPKKLRLMVEDLEQRNKLKKALGFVVIGTKKDLGMNDEAVRLADEIRNKLSQTTLRYYGYMVPHLVISNKNIEEVETALRCLESIFFETIPDREALDRLGVKLSVEHTLIRSIEGIETFDISALETDPASSVISERSVEPVARETAEKIRRKFYSIWPSEDEKAVGIARALNMLFPGNPEVYVVTYRNGTYYVAGSQKEIVRLRIKLIQRLIEMVNLDDEINKSSRIILDGEKQRIDIIKGKLAIILMITRKK